MPRRIKEDAMRTKKDILQSALDVIYEKGYTRATLVDIADRINLTKGAVYWHFKNKQELFIALSQYMEDRISKSFDHLYAEELSLNDLQDMLLEMILLVHGDSDLNKYYSIAFFRMEWTNELSRVKQFFDAQDEQLFLFVKQVFENARFKKKILNKTNIEYQVRSLLALVDGFFGYCLSLPEQDKEKSPELIRAGLGTFFKGLCKE